ncbi:tetratricopeptide repeat protein [Nostoc sp. UHCC 0926]|nr:tetratricopeptide repeat protein [Nostoc sp. UHCC 0926]
MNEQRQQDYLSLIQSLLNCRSHDEVQEILAANQDLIDDPGSVQKMLEMASNLRKQGELDQANRLMNIAGQQLGISSKLSSTAIEKEYLDFLEQVLKVTANSRGDAQVVYPLLAENTRYLNRNLAELLRRWATNKLAEVEIDAAQSIAVDIGNFSNLIREFPLGDKASNIEIAIAGYEVVSTVFTKDAFPQQWATTQNNLGIAYFDKILGDKAQNLELAIQYYFAALSVRTKDAFPQDWALTQNNLGNAYSNRILEDKAQNLELAIASYSAALSVLTRHAFPQYWALTQDNLAIAYGNRIFGEKAQNIELAIASFTNALEVRTKDTFPQDWATTQNNLGTAYFDRILGDKAQNLELAIASFTNALEVRTKDAFPQDWDLTQNNLGNAYLYRILGDKAQNLELAIASYTNALSVYTKDAFPQYWAQTQCNLGKAYCERIEGEEAQNIKLAIASYTNALSVYTKDAFPQYWATVQNSLGAVYCDRIKDEKGQNIELAIASFTKALSVRTKDAFPQDWAITQFNLGNAYGKRIFGEEAQNIELAIVFYSAALEVRTKDAFPQQWADTQFNLGNAYDNKIFGEKAENIELAIAFYSAALEVRTKDAFPQQWADTQNNLGIAYGKRIFGEKAQNVELAIASFMNALEVRTKDAFPQDWADTQFNLGNAYFYRILEKKAQNLEDAIAFYSAALEVRTKDGFPQQWADTQNHLGNAYRDRILGDKAQNLEDAIASHSAALSVLTRDAFPQNWAITQNNLGIAYFYRILGKKAQNLEYAITSYCAALSVRPKDAFPQDWAETQCNRGNAYSNRILGDKAQNLELAIQYYCAALSVLTRDAFPQQWATTQNNLGNAYSDRILGDKAQNLELAIAFYCAALEVRTKDAFPQDWAATQQNLGNAYSNKILGEKAQNLKLAIASYSAALEVKTKDTFPEDHAETLCSLGITYQNAQRFRKAYKTFKSAIKTAELLRGEIVSNDESKRKQAEKWNRFYRCMVEVCLELKKSTEAIEYVERSKTRSLVELILERDLNTIFPPEVVTQLEKLRDKIASGQNQLQNNKAENPTALAQHLQQLREKRKELQDRYLPIGSGFKFEQFQATLDDQTAVIEWYITNAGFETFIITRDSLQRLNISNRADERNPLINWFDEYLEAYVRTKTEWINSLASRLSRLAEILHLEDILKLRPETCSRLVLIPHTLLHQFPLHALPLANGDFLCDIFPDGVSYAPSCQLLQQVQLRQRPNFQSLFAIQNPTEDLFFTDLEVESILSYFPGHQVLPKKQATKAALSQAAIQLKQANYLHFSCHGFFNFNSPQNSCLVLADAYVSPDLADANPEIYVKVSQDKAVDLNKCLTLGNLFERERTFDFSQTRLVVLSACETGLIDFNNTSDEYIGLPSGFLYAGSSSVVSTLWRVNDLSTSFLMIKFIQNLKDGTDISVPLAMNQAQMWLRDATKEELHEWVNKLALDSTNKGQIRRTINKITGEQPFNSPYHWAAFTAVGK